MDIKNLINEMHDIKLQRQLLLERDEELKQRQTELESSIKSILDDMQEEYESLSEEEFQMMLADMANSSMMNIEVVYALPKKQTIKEIQIPKGASIEDSIKLSGILDECPEIDVSRQKVGVHGIIKTLSEVVHAGDRVEIYRPVTKAE
ncbi:MAG: RnfH family protein [Gammaproteobacteria bacterium]|jgi:putative ubiquitin-RnfH superfamily antitoxin RatB of RatAB toxin-antitoxin module